MNEELTPYNVENDDFLLNTEEEDFKEKGFLVAGGNGLLLRILNKLYYLSLSQYLLRHLLAGL